LPGGGFDTGFDVGFDIGTDAAQRLPTWFRGASCELRPANVTYEMRASNAQCDVRAVNMQFQTRALNIAFGLRLPNVQTPSDWPLWRPGGQTDMVDRVSGAVYVAPDGDDANSGTEASPVRTLDRASALVAVGGTIYYVGGVHNCLTQQTITKNGTASERITVCPVPGEHAIIDGSGSDYQTAVMLDGNYVTFRDMEVRNSTRQGIGIYAATGVEVLNCSVHDCWETGIINEGPSVGSNSGTLIDGCEVYRNTNHNLTGEPGYGQGISISAGSGATVRNCLVHNNMGEGIGVMKGHEGATIENNVSYDNYKINIYCDSPATGVTVDGNLCFCTGDPKYLTYNTGLRSTGITFARETGSGHLAGIVCVNNTLVGCHYGISFFEQRPDSGLVDAIFTGNAIINSIAAAMHIEPSGASGNQVTDNIFFPAPVFAGDLSGFIFGPVDPQFVAGRGNNAVVWAGALT
jgi:hypothetical protein